MFFKKRTCEHKKTYKYHSYNYDKKDFTTTIKCNKCKTETSTINYIEYMALLKITELINDSELLNKYVYDKGIDVKKIISLLEEKELNITLSNEEKYQEFIDVIIDFIKKHIQ